MKDISNCNDLKIRYLDANLCTKNLRTEIQESCNGIILEKVINRYLFDYYEANKSRYRDQDIDYEEFRDNSSYTISSINISEFDKDSARADYIISVDNYKSTKKNLILSISALFDKSSGKFVKFEYSPIPVMFREDFNK